VRFPIAILGVSYGSLLASIHQHEKLLMYALGRKLQYYDAPAVRAIVHQGAAASTLSRPS
jgi:hypothetical protein